jgi:hypothetical protein
MEVCRRNGYVKPIHCLTVGAKIVVQYLNFFMEVIDDIFSLPPFGNMNNSTEDTVFSLDKD